MRSIDARLRVLEARVAPILNATGPYLTLTEWRTYYTSGALPNAPRAVTWLQQSEQRRAQCAETIAMFEDDPAFNS